MNRIKIILSVLFLKYKMRKKEPVHFTFRNFTFSAANVRADFWKELSAGNWEPNTFNVFDAYLTKDTVYLDIGAWIGPTVCYASKIASKVIAFEPDPYAFYILEENVKLNRLSNVSLFNNAVAHKNMLLPMSSFGSALGDSQTSALKGGKGKQFVAKAKTFKDIIEAHGEPDFIKIDIEGGEFELLSNAGSFFEQHTPTLYISFHGPYLPDSERKDEMAKVHSVLSKHYSVFKNEQLEEVPVNILLEPQFYNSFFSLICES